MAESILQSDHVRLRPEIDLIADPQLSLDGLPLVNIHQAGWYARLGKPVLDALGAAIMLAILLPVFLTVATAVFLQLGRPVFLRQPRVGRGGHPFHVLKFRTMHPDRRVHEAEFDGEDRRRTHKTLDDPRHTPLGRVLRRLSLDELPQLLNVLRGEMSLVGPRPELVPLVRRYAPWQHQRHAVKPGITGLWQTTMRGDGPMHEFVHLDLEYIRTMSFATDMRLLWHTIAVLLKPKAI